MTEEKHPSQMTGEELAKKIDELHAEMMAEEAKKRTKKYIIGHAIGSGLVTLFIIAPFTLLALQQFGGIEFNWKTWIATAFLLAIIQGLCRSKS